MTHIMVGDGVLPWWLSGAGILASVVLVTIASRQVTRTGSRRAIPATGVMTALMHSTLTSARVDWWRFICLDLANTRRRLSRN
ncbi:MAG: hypothetical protein EB145_11815 [Proteobacteria bacterium]|nr:hypothetical protein [Pseudomonadota bacterium]